MMSTDLKPPAQKSAQQRTALRQFALSITVLTVIGHLFLGFEQSFAQPLVALAVGYTMQILLEYLYARSHAVRPAYAGGFRQLVDFLLPVHVASLSIAMLLYFNDRLWIVAFATAVAVASKTVFRVPVRKGSRHFFNPSNFALSTTFVLFPSVGLTMPWQWTTEIHGLADWLAPIFIFIVGFMLHLRYASRIWVVIAFLVSFVVQAVVRSVFLDMNLLTALAPATGVAAMIFTFYMAPDPGTSPSNWRGQIVFGASISAVYMFLMFMHVVFALFYALTIVCFVRGILLAVSYYSSQKDSATVRSRFAIW